MIIAIIGAILFLLVVAEGLVICSDKWQRK